MQRLTECCSHACYLLANDSRYKLLLGMLCWSFHALLMDVAVTYDRQRGQRQLRNDVVQVLVQVVTKRRNGKPVDTSRY